MTKPTIDLSKATDAEIEAAVAEHCAGWHWAEANKSGMLYLRPKGGNTDGWTPCEDANKTRMYRTSPRYLTDANAVLALLEKYQVEATFSSGMWCMQLSAYPVDNDSMEVCGKAVAKSLCRAACLSLLKAAGVEVKDTP